MIHARTTCYTGWDEAYHSYLASGYHDHPAASQYVCVDENPQTLIGGESVDANGMLFYQVRTRCGSLKCHPYEEDKEKRMATSNFDQGNTAKCKVNRRDIALLLIAVLVLIQGAAIVYIIAAHNTETISELQTKLRMHQDEIEKQNDTIGKQNDTIGKQKEEYEKQQDKIKEHQDKLTSINTELEKSKTNQGVVYVRWGRNDCAGNGTETVYSGYVGGSLYNDQGAAAEYVCLPPDPTWGSKKDTRSYGPGLMYGAEYEDEILFNVPDKNRDVPCAVCRSSDQSTSIMIPARTTCYTGWDEAYHGYLASGYHDQNAASQYVCVDENPQTLIGGGSVNDDGILFYQVRTRCGSLKCPPYENDKVLSCVVCLK